MKQLMEYGVPSDAMHVFYVGLLMLPLAILAGLWIRDYASANLIPNVRRVRRTRPTR